MLQRLHPLKDRRGSASICDNFIPINLHLQGSFTNYTNLKCCFFVHTVLFAYYDRQITPPDKTPAIHCHSLSHSPQRIASITLTLNFECASVTITVIVCIQNLVRYTFTGILKQHTKDCCMQLWLYFIINEWVCPPGQMSKSLERVFHRLLHGGQLEYRAEELECILNIGAAVWGLCISGEMMRFSETELAKFPGSCVWAQKPGNEARSKGAVGAEVALFFPGSFVRVCMSAGAWTLAMHRCYLMWLQYGRGGRSSSRGSGS